MEPVAYHIQDSDGVAVVRLTEHVKPNRLIAVTVTPLFASSAAALHAALDKMTDDQRAALFHSYCRECGSKDPTCQCWNHS